MGDKEHREEIVIPEKAYFRIGEVSNILQLKPYVIRYWETEFKQLKPNKTRTNQRVYSRADVQLLLTIKTLLYHDNFTIAGARKQLAERSGQVDLASKDPGGKGDDRTELPSSKKEQLASTQMRSFLSNLDGAKSQASRLQKKLDQINSKCTDLEKKLSEERKLRSTLISFLQKELGEAIKLTDSVLEEED